MEAQDNIRKRVCKACDRCRLKKSKCDGASPCSRCKADNAICVFGERKKSQDKVYPKGYVEMLEQQQAQLVAALRELYQRLHKGQGWPGKPLNDAHNGHPLTHDILERLDLLHPTSDSDSNFEFEEDPNRMQQKLVAGGAPYTHRRGSLSSDSDRGHTSPSVSSYNSTPTAKPMSYDGRNGFARNTTPPTPPMTSPFPRQSQIVAPLKQTTPIPHSMFTNPGALDMSALSGSDWPPQTIVPAMIDNQYQLEFDKEVPYNNGYNFETTMMLDPSMNSNLGPMGTGWHEEYDMEYAMNAMQR